MQDLAKTIPLEVVGPWRCIRGYRGWVMKHLPRGLWQVGELEEEEKLLRLAEGRYSLEMVPS